MKELTLLLIGTIALFLAIPLGNLLRNLTKEELKGGKKYFKIILYISILAGFTGLIINQDWMLFTFFFIAIVTSRSLKK